MPDCERKDAWKEVAIHRIANDSRTLTRCIAYGGFLALTACATGIQPVVRGVAPLPDRLGAAQPAARDTQADAGDVSALFPRGAERDSLNAMMSAAIANVSAAFEVPDSLVAGPRASIGMSEAESTDVEEATSWDIDVNSYVTQDKVAHYVNLFLGSAKPRFAASLQKGKRYEPMIRSKFRAAGIPEDMYFLALVESGYEPHAYSRAAAVGIWQFMTSTAHDVGLRVDWWVDERRDPMRSTDAAARFIGDLRTQFGSLYLAAAAYNGGPGRVSRGLKKYDDQMDDVSGDDRFFALAEQDYLRAETKNYVPQLIAAALLGKNPANYGIVLDSVPVFAYDSAVVPALTPLAAVAKVANAGLSEIQVLNPHFLRGSRPPAPPRRSGCRSATQRTSTCAFWHSSPRNEKV
ncbi:MAG: lytic transglycosylase domain-containing protein [Gemmatimonadaceae bacterium]